MRIGTSFSHRHSKELGIDPVKAMAEIAALEFDTIRLGCYWSDIEKNRGEYDFSETDKMVSACEKEKTDVVLTVGMKSFRWPEYYLPSWVTGAGIIRRGLVYDKGNSFLLENTLGFIEKCVLRYRASPSVKIWQVENEPFDPAGYGQSRISTDFLKSEVDLVKKIEPGKKVMVTVWGNELTKRGVYKEAASVADIVGLNIYLRQPASVLFGLHHVYSGPADSTDSIIKTAGAIIGKNKDFWLAELQSEPWETDGTVTRKNNPPSMLPEHIPGNFDYAAKLNPSTTLLWGSEWWLYRKMKGDRRYWDEIAKILENR